MPDDQPDHDYDNNWWYSAVAFEIPSNGDAILSMLRLTLPNFCAIIATKLTRGNIATVKIGLKDVKKHRISEVTLREVSTDGVRFSESTGFTKLCGTGSDHHTRLLCEALALSRGFSAAFVAELLDTGWSVVGAYRDSAHRDVPLHVPDQMEVDRDIETRIGGCCQQDAGHAETCAHFVPIVDHGKLIGVIGLIDVTEKRPATPSERLAMFRFAELAGRRIIERSLFRLHAREAFALFDGDLEGTRAARTGCQ